MTAQPIVYTVKNSFGTGLTVAEKREKQQEEETGIDFISPIGDEVDSPDDDDSEGTLSMECEVSKKKLCEENRHVDSHPGWPLEREVKATKRAKEGRKK